MLHRLILGLALLLAPASALATSAKLYNPSPNAIYDTTGAIARGAKAYFYAAGTGTPITVYQNGALTTPLTYPVTAGLNGVLPAIYLPYVDYRVRITTSAGSVIFDQDNIENQAPPSSTAPTTESPGLLLWNQTRQQWLGNKRSEKQAQLREPTIRLVIFIVFPI